MRKINHIILSVVLCISVLTISACAEKPKYLDEKFKDYFDVGIALSKNSLNLYDDEILKNFNSVVAENEMKWESIQPNEGTFIWKNADKLVQKASALDMKLRGHTLLWHSQTPSWVFSGTYEEVEARLMTHISSVVTRYKDDIYEWDVANEVLSDSSNAGELFRSDSGWYKACGKNDAKFIELLTKAYKKVKEIAPNARLYYNDYNLNFAHKRDKAVRLVTALKANGAPIEAVGMQGHYDIHGLKLIDVEESIKAFIAAGMKVRLTELDLSVYQGGYSGSPYTEISKADEKKQADVYEGLFRLGVKYSGDFIGITTWGVADDATWKDNFPVKNRKDFPLLFDTQGGKKEAFTRLMKMKI